MVVNNKNDLQQKIIIIKNNTEQKHPKYKA